MAEHIEIKVNGNFAYFNVVPMQSFGDIAISITESGELCLDIEGHDEWKTSHVSREMVSAMLPYLKQYAETGEIGEPT